MHTMGIRVRRGENGQVAKTSQKKIKKKKLKMERTTVNNGGES